MADASGNPRHAGLMAMAALLKPMAVEMRGVSVRLGGAVVLHDVHLPVAQGKWISIVGPNGAGKSTLLKAMASVQPHTGEVLLHGAPIAQIPRRQRAQQLSWLGQNETTNDDLTVYDVVMLGRLPHQAWLASPNAQDVASVERALADTQAWAWRHRSLGQLSGGERQRVLLARALAVEADVLLMDEPLANLDPPHRSDWLALVRRLVSERKTVVSVLHELSVALQADELVLMAQGRVAHQGAASDPQTHRALEVIFDNRIAVHPVAGQWVALST